MVESKAHARKLSHSAPFLPARGPAARVNALLPLRRNLVVGVAVAPKRYYHARVKTLTVKLPDPLFVEISRAAEERNVPKSEIVRERLEQAGTSGSSLWSRMEDLVLSDDDVPQDLSSNKAHLDGYGKNRDRR